MLSFATVLAFGQSISTLNSYAQPGKSVICVLFLLVCKQNARSRSWRLKTSISANQILTARSMKILATFLSLKVRNL